MGDLIVSVPDHCLSFYFTSLSGSDFEHLPRDLTNVICKENHV